MTRKHIIFSATNTPQRISGADFLFKTASFWGYKSFVSGVPTANSANAYVGFTTGELPMTIGTGSYFNWTVHPNQAESLYNMWTQGSSGDGVYLIAY